MKPRIYWWPVVAGAAGLWLWFGATSFSAFLNFETAPVHPVALAPDGNLLAVCNLPDYRIELFDVSGGMPLPLGDVPVGVDPVSLRFRTTHELWAVNHISSTVSIVDVAARRVVATLETKTGPADVAFAGSPQRAFVSCATENLVQVFDPITRQALTNIVIDGDRPKAMAVSPDGRRLYVAVFESGNASTLVTGQALRDPSGPYEGQMPPPNNGTDLHPPLHIDTNVVSDVYDQLPDSLIVKRNASGLWMDDNHGDWTEFISGTNSALTGRPPGWDMPDRDLAIIDTQTYEVTYASGLMNICTDLAVNPASGQIAVIGTDATNERRFEPNLRGTFIRVNLALVNSLALSPTILDLNPHLDYSTSSAPASVRNQSIGDPRGILWNTAGTRGYVTGMGSRNLVVIDANGHRVTAQPVELEEGPTGLALEESRQRLYVLNRFSATLSVIDTASLYVLTNVVLFDPTPSAIKAGRKHLYDTRRNSGLGQLACASCHVDARFDRLAWDLSNPAGPTRIHSGEFHPLKGPLVTQTFQDIIGHEPLHWRGDRIGIEDFNATFTDLLGAEALLSTGEMQEFKDFLATIHFPPNRFRNFDNSLPADLAVPGLDGLDANGTPLPHGNAQRGRDFFANNCARCHQNPAGRGTGGDDILVRREGGRPFKVAQLRSLPDKLGMDKQGPNSRAGFGFRFDGRDDSLTRFLADTDLLPGDTQDLADLLAFLMAFSGSGTERLPFGFPGDSRDAPAALGRQMTLATAETNAILTAMLALANGPSNRVDLVARGVAEGLNRGWFYDRETGRFQSDRHGENHSTDNLLALATSDAPLTFMLVSAGTGVRGGIDRDNDGRYDRTELDHGADPNDPCSLDTLVTPASVSLADLAVHPVTLIKRSVAAAYAAEPCQSMSFELVLDVPEGATIHPTTGLFTWAVPAQAAGISTVTLRISFNRTPPYATTNTFRVTVVPLEVPEIMRDAAGTVFLRWQGIDGAYYRVQYKHRLEDASWRALEDVPRPDHWAWDSTAQTNTQRFYRIEVAN